MPELPEVETVVRELQSIEGKVLDSLVSYWDRTIEEPVKGFLKALKGREVSRVFRRGKYICLEIDSGDFVTIHLRMTGKLVFEPTERDMNYARVEFIFKDKSKLYFIDIRKFGRIKRWPAKEPFLPTLGPEPLMEDDVYEALKSCRSVRDIKKVLLDQSVLTGVGNIYADESLFLSRIHPLTSLQKVSTVKLKKLSSVIPQVMHAAINNMGTTLSDYRNTKNVGGENQNYLRVYGQTGLPCSVCKTSIEKIVVGQRGTHFCPKCQRQSK